MVPSKRADLHNLLSNSYCWEDWAGAAQCSWHCWIVVDNKPYTVSIPWTPFSSRSCKSKRTRKFCSGAITSGSNIQYVKMNSNETVHISNSAVYGNYLCARGECLSTSKLSYLWGVTCFLAGFLSQFSLHMPD